MEINMNFKKLLVTLTAGAMLLSGCAAGGKTAVKVGDSAITDNMIKFVGEQMMSGAKPQNVADALKQSYLICEIGNKMGLTLSDEETLAVRQQIASFKANQGGKTAGDKLLKSYGVDDSLLNVLSSSSLYSEKFSAQLDLGEPTDEEIRQHFKDDYLRAKHVLIPTTDMTTGADLDEAALAEAEKKANEVLEKAKNGENFDTLIKDYNEDPGMEGSPDGYFFTDNQMVSEFEEATKSIQPGEFTLCKSDYGYHIIQRLPIEGDDFDKFYEDNKSSVESSYESVQEQKAIDDKAAELGITIEEYEDVINSVTIEEVDLSAQQ